jgi:hypothetical protein
MDGVPRGKTWTGLTGLKDGLTGFKATDGKGN